MTIIRHSSSVSKRKRWAIGLLFTYIALLMCSHAIRHRQPDPWTAPESLLSVTMPAKKNDRKRSSSPVVMRYMDTQRADSPNDPVLLLIHGSPMAASSVFPELTNHLNGSGRVLAPDLPGFGFSTRQVDDYSFRSHATYLLHFLDRIGVNQAHLVADSMGGGAAIYMAANHPDRVASLTLISSIGVQELELLGDYQLNHALHGFQLGALWSLQELTPHMGWLDRLSFNTHYARNFFDSDQRPLRGLLQRISQPVLILHGRDDQFVPLAAAQEHHRLVPHSTLVTISGGHLALFQKTPEMAAMAARHIEDTLNDTTLTLAQADASRRIAAQASVSAIRLPQVTGLQLLCYAVLIALATLVSEDLACIGAGLIAARGIIGFIPATLAALAGIVIGDLLLYLAGRVIGRPAVRKAPIRWFIKAKDVSRATQWFQAKGPSIIFVSRFLPGSRLPVYFTAGVLGGRLWSFLFYFCIAAAIWTPGIVGISMLTGNRVLAYYAEFQESALWVALGTMLMLWLIVRMGLPLFSLKRRRQLLSKYKRLRQRIKI